MKTSLFPVRIVDLNYVVVKEGPQAGKELVQMMLQQKTFVQKENGELKPSTNKARFIKPDDWSLEDVQEMAKNKEIFPGITIDRVECAEYDYTTPDGEVIKVSHVFKPRFI